MKLFKDIINGLKEKKMFKNLEHSTFLPSGFLIVLVFIILWGGSFALGRSISGYLLKDVTAETLKVSLRSIITCGFQIFIFFVWVRVIEKRKFSTVGFRQNHTLYRFFIGFFAGIISITIITLVLFLVGAVQIEVRKNMNVSISTCAVIVVIVAGWLVQSAFEEIAIRGWLVPLLGKKYNVTVSVFIASISFGVLHLFVPTATVISFANLTLSGVFFALYAISEDCLWGVWGLHFGWNLALGNIYGFSVSGFSARDSVLFKIKSVGSDVLTGGSFGPEGAILATLAVVIGILLCCIKIVNDQLQN